MNLSTDLIFAKKEERYDRRTQPEGLGAPLEECNQSHPMQVRCKLRASKPLKMPSFPVARTNAKLCYVRSVAAEWPM